MADPQSGGKIRIRLYKPNLTTRLFASGCSTFGRSLYLSFERQIMSPTGYSVHVPRTDSTPRSTSTRIFSRRWSLSTFPSSSLPFLSRTAQSRQFSSFSRASLNGLSPNYARRASDPSRRSDQYKWYPSSLSITYTQYTSLTPFPQTKNAA